MKEFNNAVRGVSPEQSRAAFYQNGKVPQQEKTMLEKEQLVPVLKPHGMGEQAVDRIHYRARLKQEHDRVQRQHDKVKQRQQTQSKTAPIDNTKKTTNDFNMQAEQAHKQRTKDLSY